MSESENPSWARNPGDLAFGRAAAIGAIVSAVLAVGSVLTGLAAVGFNFAAMADPMLLLRAGQRAASLWRASLLLDLFGYYLLIVPLILTLRATFWPRAGSWSDLFSFCLLSYCLIGAIGAAMMAMAVPPIIEAYAGAGPAERQILVTTYTAQSNDVYRGLWNLLEVFLGGVGWIGFGWLLRSDGRAVAALTFVLGISTLANSLGMIANREEFHLGALNLYLFLAPAWALVMGIRLLAHSPAR
jgi:hypothetical protein